MDTVKIKVPSSVSMPIALVAMVVGVSCFYFAVRAFMDGQALYEAHTFKYVSAQGPKVAGPHSAVAAGMIAIA